MIEPLNHPIAAARRLPLRLILHAGVLGLFLMLLLLSGCAVLVRSPVPVADLPADLPATWHTQTDTADLPITAGLLHLIDSPRAHRLVQEALANNTDLRATALRLRSARYLLALPAAERLPQVTGRYGLERHNEGMDPTSGKRRTVDVQRATLGVSWEIDIWGRLADEVAAARGQHEAQAWEYRYARDALASRVLQAWIEQIATQRSIQISKNRLKALRSIEAVLLDRYRNGIGNLDELDTARTRTAVAQADLSELISERQMAIGELEILLGRYPRGELFADQALPTITPPSTALPATALLQRPDIQAALTAVEAAGYRARAAGKARLPSLSLSGQVFKESASLATLGGTTTHWNLLGALFQPLFDGGRLRNAARSQRAEAQATLMEMRGRVLRALKEVEDGLVLERELGHQTTALRQAATAASKSSQFYERRYRQGLDSLQSLLIAREQAVYVNLRLNRVEAACLRNRIDLALALGVGATQPPTAISGEDPNAS